MGSGQWWFTTAYCPVPSALFANPSPGYSLFIFRIAPIAAS